MQRFTERFTVMLAPAMFKKMKALAKKEGMPISEWVRMIIAKHLLD